MIALPANEQEDWSLDGRHWLHTERQWWPMEGRGSVIPDGNSKFLSPASAGRPPRGCGGAARWCAETQRGTDMTKSKGRASAKPRSGTKSRSKRDDGSRREWEWSRPWYFLLTANRSSAIPYPKIPPLRPTP